MKTGRRFTIAARVNPNGSDFVPNNGRSVSPLTEIHTCKFCDKIIKKSDDSISPCRCNGISKLVHRKCLATYILSPKNQLCLQPKCSACETFYNYYTESQQKCRFCPINEKSKRLYCFLGLLILVSLWVTALVYCFAGEKDEYFEFLAIFLIVCILLCVTIFFRTLCMEEDKMVFLQEYVTLVRSKSIQNLNVPQTEELKIDIDNMEQ